MDEEYYYRIYNNASLPLYNRATQQLSAPGIYIQTSHSDRRQSSAA